MHKTNMFATSLGGMLALKSGLHSFVSAPEVLFLGTWKQALLPKHYKPLCFTHTHTIWASCPKYQRRESEAICCPHSIILRTLPLMLTTSKKGRQEAAALRRSSSFGETKSSHLIYLNVSGRPECDIFCSCIIVVCFSHFLNGYGACHTCVLVF